MPCGQGQPRHVAYGIMTTTYYAYLRDRMAGAPGLSLVQLGQFVDAERNALWQAMIANPAYDERARMGALAAFDEAAGRLLSEQESRFAAGPAVRPAAAPQHGGRARGAQAEPAPHGASARSWRRDATFLLIGLVVGLALAYLGAALLHAGPGGRSGAAEPALVPSTSSFKFVRSSPSEQAGEIKVERGGGAAGSQCEVEVTYRQLLEYVRFDAECRTVTFKFRPLPELLENFNYLQGYMVFTATITTAGNAWKGTSSVYFSIDASA